MKQTIILILLCFTAIFAIAQENIAVKYDVSNGVGDNGKVFIKPMVLVANPQKSLYYNTESLYCDSCESTPEGRTRLREMQMKAWTVVHPDGSVTLDGRKLGLVPEKNVFLYVAKNHDKEILNVYDYMAGELVSYDEPIPEIEWSIVEDSTKTIKGYECIMAKSDYHGRTWTVWFTPEIPLPEGPWKLRGLPGLILSADGGNDFRMEATEIGRVNREVPDVYSKNDYAKGERRKILANNEHYFNNLESIMAAQGIKINGDGSPANLPKYDRQRKAWETDY